MKLLDHLKLALRAYRYKVKHDPGGITYLLSAIKEGQTVMDIGAHKAGYLYYFRNLVGPKGRVFAFEPQSPLYHYLEKLKEQFQWDNVTLEHLALSDTQGSAELFIPSNKASVGTSPGASIVAQQYRSEAGITETVRTETLDAYCQKHQIRPSFLKIDVEGNELNVFQGGTQILKQWKPRILVEIEARHVGQERVLETFRYLKELGYQGFVLHGLDRMPLDQFQFSVHQNTEDKKNYCNNFIFE